MNVISLLFDVASHVILHPVCQARREKGWDIAKHSEPIDQTIRIVINRYRPCRPGFVHNQHQQDDRQGCVWSWMLWPTPRHLSLVTTRYFWRLCVLYWTLLLSCINESDLSSTTTNWIQGVPDKSWNHELTWLMTQWDTPAIFWLILIHVIHLTRSSSTVCRDCSRWCRWVHHASPESRSMSQRYGDGD